MSIKPWLSKNFLQMMSWSSVRDYPPKTKKAWLYDSFMEMEEIHSDHMEKPFLPPDGPLPPSPDIPQEPEPEPDPCEGPRSLWVLVNPATVDCDSDGGFVLIISPDFKCIQIDQAFPELTSASLRQRPDGSYEIEEGCEPEDAFITIRVTDCLCGGGSSVNIFLENCVTICEEVSLSGPETMAASSTAQFVLAGSKVKLWSVDGIDATISQTGLVTTGPSTCGVITVTAETKCCDDFVQEVRIDGGLWGTATKVCVIDPANDIYSDTCGTGAGADCVIIDGGRKHYYSFVITTESCEGLEYYYQCCGRSAPGDCEVEEPPEGFITHMACYAYQDWECAP